MYDSRLDKAPRLKSLLPQAPPGSLTELPLELFLFDDAQLSVVYAPVDYVNTRARIVLAGLTLGWRQAREAYAAHAELGAQGDEHAGAEIKRRTALTGSMRTNLTLMLDELSVHHYLGLNTTAELFGERFDAVHATSVLRYPVFKAGKNYSGQHPKPASHPFLRAMLERLCAPELESIPNALIIPLGKAVEEGLEYLSELGMLRRDRWLRGFPHPSASNAHRKSEFERAHADLQWQIEAWFSRGSLPPPRLTNDWQGQGNGHSRLSASL